MKSIKRLLILLITSILLVTAVFSYGVLGYADVNLSDFKGKTIGVQSGTIFDGIIRENIESPKIQQFNTNADLALALNTNKIDCYVCDEPVWRIMNKTYPNQEKVYTFQDEDYGYLFKKGDKKSLELCNKMNDFLDKCKKDGTLEEVDRIWFGDDESLQTVDLSSLTGENGTLVLGVGSDIGAPFVYLKDNKIVGYDVDIAVRFCKEYGYGIKIVDGNFAGLLPSVTSGKVDFGASCVSITEQRKESVLFSEPNYRGGSVLVVKTSDEIIGEDIGEDIGFFESIAKSFEKTFIIEQRYKSFLNGIFHTMIIVLSSILLGTVLGFILYFGYYKCGKIYKAILGGFSKIIEYTPVVVILMILYYVIFGSARIDGIWVSVICFTLMFSASVVESIKISVQAIDPGQREAALALGYSENKTLFKIILPQASKYFLPGYKSAVVQLIKSTAIVGYIAVEDLTRASDIIRSRTYEAFFPLISGAVLYFIIAMVIAYLISKIEIKVDVRSRKKSKILKGVVKK